MMNMTTIIILNNQRNIKQKTINHLTYQKVIKRGMFSRAIRLGNNATRHVGLTPTTRPYHIAAGKIKEKILKIVPSLKKDAEGVYSDTQGHPIVGVKVCRDQPQCHKRKCDTTDKEICTSKTDNDQMTMELAGNLTHKVPQNTPGILLDTHDANGHSSPQFMVKEEATVPLNPQTFIKDEKKTDFVQQDHVREKIISNMPENSIMKLKETSQMNTPKDED